MTAPAIFHPADYVRELEQAAEGWEIRYLSPCPSSTRPWLQRIGPGTNPPTLYLSAGIHGNEVSGLWAIVEMLRRPGFFRDFSVTIFPLLNPEGLARNIRGNADGIDLNRDYRELKSAEIAGHIAALQTLGRFDAAMFLHEDFEGIGAYLYELNDELPASLGADIIAAMGRHVPIDLRPEIEEVTARGGVLLRSDFIAKHGSIEERRDWPEAIYLSAHHTRVSYTTETPLSFPLAQRVEAQIAAVTALMDAVEKHHREKNRN
jgi:hypothetical protein